VGLSFVTGDPFISFARKGSIPEARMKSFLFMTAFAQSIISSRVVHAGLCCIQIAKREANSLKHYISFSK